MSSFMNRVDQLGEGCISHPNNFAVGGYGGPQEKQRGRPKRVEIMFEDLQKPELINDDFLVFP